MANVNPLCRWQPQGFPARMLGGSAAAVLAVQLEGLTGLENQITIRPDVRGAGMKASVSISQSILENETMAKKDKGNTAVMERQDGLTDADGMEGIVTTSTPLVPVTTPDAEQAAKAETDAKAAEAAAAAVPNPVIDGKQLTTAGAVSQSVAFDSLYRADNVRTEQTLQIAPMVESIKRHGFKPNHPLVVSAKSDGRFLVLCGNRRMEAIEQIHSTEPAEFARLFPDGNVPAVVYFNLTTEQEILLRIDHGKDEDRVPLDEYGEFLAIRQLVKAGYHTETGIAEKLGKYKANKETGKPEPKRSWVQPRVALAQLPAFVQEEFRKLWTEGPAATPVRVSMILKPLYKVFNEEYRNFPDGNGPQFQGAWAECLGKVHDKPAAKIVITPAAALERSKHVGSRNLRDALKVVAGEAAEIDGKAMSIADVDAALVAAEAAQVTLIEIAEFLGETEFADLVRDAQHAAEQKRIAASQTRETQEAIA